MGKSKKMMLQGIAIIILMFSIISCGAVYYFYFFTPKNSLELYQAISFAKDFEEAQKLTLEGYEDHFKKEDFDYINRLGRNAINVSQFTAFEYNEKTYLVMTSPGTEKLKILAVEELPKDVREYFRKISPRN
ncbi:hypothetical protein ACTHO0_10480 [Cytobacillus praedii]|uniref:hypothetical protein n=1 Tax=Cytobacillus praedii TaxID=1742358 RepID=UPI003F7D4D10